MIRHSDPLHRVSILLSIVLLVVSVCFYSTAAAEQDFLPMHEHTLDLVCITIPGDSLWNEETGLFAEGEAINKKNGLPFANSVYGAQVGSVREAMLEYYPAGNDTPTLSESVQISLVDGILNLDLPQKSLNVYATDGLFDYPLFPGRESSGYHAFVLSNGEGDGPFTRIAGGVQTELLSLLGTNNLLIPAWKPVVVYINGEYWGHYNMVEASDVQTVCRYEELPSSQADHVTIVSSTGRAIHGDNTAYIEMRSRLSESSPNTNMDDRLWLDQHIDADNYLTWFASAVFFASSTPDQVLFYQFNGGQWKCIARPSAYGLYSSEYNSLLHYLNTDSTASKTFDSTVFRKILEVDEYRELFLQKLGNVYRTLTTEVMQETLDNCAALIAPEMQKHFGRWAPFHEPIIVHEWPTESEAALEYWQTRITRMRSGTMAKRPYYVYCYTQEAFALNDQQMKEYFGGPCPEAPED